MTTRCRNLPRFPWLLSSWIMCFWKVEKLWSKCFQMILLFSCTRPEPPAGAAAPRASVGPERPRWSLTASWFWLPETSAAPLQDHTASLCERRPGCPSDHTCISACVYLWRAFLGLNAVQWLSLSTTDVHFVVIFFIFIWFIFRKWFLLVFVCCDLIIRVLGSQKSGERFESCSLERDKKQQRASARAQLWLVQLG